MSSALELVRAELKKQLDEAPAFGLERMAVAHTIGVLHTLVAKIEEEEKKPRKLKAVRRTQ